MTVTVAETDDDRHRALVPAGERPVLCCEPGHPDAAEAALHAWKLARAIARHEAKASAAT